jgi:hypothetical protein
LKVGCASDWPRDIHGSRMTAWARLNFRTRD